MRVFLLENLTKRLHFVVSPPSHCRLHEPLHPNRFRFQCGQPFHGLAVDDVSSVEVDENVVDVTRVLNDVAVKLFEECSV